MFKKLFAWRKQSDNKKTSRSGVPTIQAAMARGYKLMLLCDQAMDMEFQPSSDAFELYVNGQAVEVSSAFLQQFIHEETGTVVLATENEWREQDKVRVVYNPRLEGLRSSKGENLLPFDQKFKIADVVTPSTSFAEHDPFKQGEFPSASLKSAKTVSVAAATVASSALKNEASKVVDTIEVQADASGFVEEVFEKTEVEDTREAQQEPIEVLYTGAVDNDVVHASAAIPTDDSNIQPELEEIVPNETQIDIPVEEVSVVTEAITERVVEDIDVDYVNPVVEKPADLFEEILLEPAPSQEGLEEESLQEAGLEEEDLEEQEQIIADNSVQTFELDSVQQNTAEQLNEVDQAVDEIIDADLEDVLLDDSFKMDNVSIETFEAPELEQASIQPAADDAIGFVEALDEFEAMDQMTLSDEPIMDETIFVEPELSTDNNHIRLDDFDDAMADILQTANKNVELHEQLVSSKENASESRQEKAEAQYQVKPQQNISVQQASYPAPIQQPDQTHIQNVETEQTVQTEDWVNLDEIEQNDSPIVESVSIVSIDSHLVEDQPELQVDQLADSFEDLTQNEPAPIVEPVVERFIEEDVRSEKTQAIVLSSEKQEEPVASSISETPELHLVKESFRISIYGVANLDWRIQPEKTDFAVKTANLDLSPSAVFVTKKGANQQAIVVLKFKDRLPPNGSFLVKYLANADSLKSLDRRDTIAAFELSTNEHSRSDALDNQSDIAYINGLAKEPELGEIHTGFSISEKAIAGKKKSLFKRVFSK